MKKQTLQKNILAVVAGILFTGLILNTLEQIAPTKVLSMNESALVAVEEESVKYFDSNQIQERILEEAVSTRAQDSKKLKKIENVRTYLLKRSSPLAEYAEEIVNAADEYGIDYRLVASISIIESSGGKHTFRTYNAWGWGKMNFSSWEEGIWTVSKGLGIYYSKGLTTPQRISVYYCPPSAPDWARKVSLVMNEIGDVI